MSGMPNRILIFPYDRVIYPYYDFDQGGCESKLNIQPCSIDNYYGNSCRGVSLRAQRVESAYEKPASNC